MTLTIYLFSISYNLETNNDDGKIHYYSGKYHGAENGSPVFDMLHDRETNQYIGKKTIANFGQLKPQISEYMGFFRGIRKEEEEKIRERRETERKEIEGGRPLGFCAIDLMRNPQLYNWN